MTRQEALIILLVLTPAIAHVIYGQWATRDEDISGKYLALITSLLCGPLIGLMFTGVALALYVLVGGGQL